MSDNQVVQLTLEEVHALSMKALLASGTRHANAESVARSIVAAEADGIHSHGLMRLPTYCDHVRMGKVDGHAQPTIVHPLPAALRVDAAQGFAHPAIDLGFSRLIPGAKQQGITTLAVTNSYNCGVVGYHVERLANEGLIGIAFVNAPAAIAPWGGTIPLFGTNPIAFAAPRGQGFPLVIDQSSSTVARGEVMLKARRGEPIPEDWGLDRNGKPTTNPESVLSGGSMAPAGGYKGVAMALMVEIMAAVLTGANLSFQAPSVIDDKGGPPRIGQFFIALEPTAFVGAAYRERMEILIAAILDQKGTRLPGERRKTYRVKAAAQGIQISRALFEELAERASNASSQK